MPGYTECPLRNGNHKSNRKEIKLHELQDFFRQYGFQFTFPDPERTFEECDGIPKQIKCKHCAHLIQEFGAPGPTIIFSPLKNQPAPPTT